MSLEIIVLAAGKGSRMRSTQAKVLHPLAGEPMLAHVLRAARALKPARVHVVIGHQAETVSAAFADAEVNWVIQTEQKGTGHAVMQVLPALAPEATVLVMNGDVPLIRPESLAPLTRASSGIHLLTARLDEPTGFGRILRDAEGRVRGIVEEKDATAKQKAIQEINTGLMAMPASRMRRWLEKIDSQNAQGEYYLTDVIALAVADKLPVDTMLADTPYTVLGVNSRAELAHLERLAQRERAQALMDSGVSLADPARVDVRGAVRIGSDSYIDVGVVIEQSDIGAGVTVGAHSVIRNSRIADGVTIEPHSVIDGARIEREASIGPFARLRPGSDLAARTRIGNFVEVKNTRLGEGSKVNHLSYVGDAVVGSQVNIGAGVITCNYDGANKHQTTIGDRAFIGSDTQLVAPVEVGADATIGAGSTIRKNAPEGELTLSRAPQNTVPGWQRPAKPVK